MTTKTNKQAATKNPDVGQGSGLGPRAGLTPYFSEFDLPALQHLIHELHLLSYRTLHPPRAGLNSLAAPILLYKPTTEVIAMNKLSFKKQIMFVNALFKGMIITSIGRIWLKCILRIKTSALETNIEHRKYCPIINWV